MVPKELNLKSVGAICFLAELMKVLEGLRCGVAALPLIVALGPRG